MDNGLISGRSSDRRSPSLPKNKNLSVFLAQKRVHLILFMKLQTAHSQTNTAAKRPEYEI